MNAAKLISELRQQGIEVSAENNMLRCRAPKGVLTPEICKSLAEYKERILTILREKQDQDSAIPEAQVDLRSSSEADQSWPAECLECEKRIGQKHARLFPLLGRRVSTSVGSGTLWQVFQQRAAVLIADNLIFIHPDKVWCDGTFLTQGTRKGNQ
jgi:hypothetical protein